MSWGGERILLNKCYTVQEREEKISIFWAGQILRDRITDSERRSSRKRNGQRQSKRERERARKEGSKTKR